MMTNRKYLPTLGELIDRMAIVQLKAIFIPENRGAYDREIEDICHDIDLCLADVPLTAKELRAVIVNAFCNREIWLNESKARAGGPEQDRNLKFTHSINGIRNQSKNLISQAAGERVDLRTDCLAADLPKEYGNWDIWGMRCDSIS